MFSLTAQTNFRSCVCARPLFLFLPPTDFSVISIGVYSFSCRFILFVHVSLCVFFSPTLSVLFPSFFTFQLFFRVNKNLSPANSIQFSIPFFLLSIYSLACSSVTLALPPPRSTDLWQTGRKTYRSNRFQTIQQPDLPNTFP